MHHEGVSAVVDRYGLPAFPFGERELDPLNDAEDVKRVSWIDGWADVRKVIAPVVASHAESGKPLLIVVDGPSGTGRSSMVNLLAHLWVTNRRPPGPALIVPCRARTNAGEEGLMRWALAIEPLLERAPKFTLLDPTAMRFEKLESEMRFSLLPRLLRRVVADLKLSNGTLVGVIEDVKDSSYFKAAVEVLPAADSLIVMTVDTTRGNDQTVLGNVDEDIKDIGGRNVSLRALTPDEGRAVVDQRWECVAGGAAPPWTDHGLRGAFGTKDRPLRDIIRLIGGVLVLHTQTSEQPAIADHVLLAHFEAIEQTL